MITVFHFYILATGTVLSSTHQHRPCSTDSADRAMHGAERAGRITVLLTELVLWYQRQVAGVYMHSTPYVPYTVWY